MTKHLQAMPRRSFRPAHASRPRQQGIVLIVAMVMLVVIGLASVAVMRGALNADTVSDNTRRQAQALQMAQAALRFCENGVVDATHPPAAAAATVDQEAWRTFTNWNSDSAFVQTVTRAFLTDNSMSADAQAAAVPHPPQCMAQTRAMSGTNPVVVVTARGFSDNFTEVNGRVQSGSVVWLQSIVQLAAASED